MSSLDVRTYSPSEVIFSFGGANVEGWDRIAITKDHPDFKIIPGIRGKNTRVPVGNKSATVELTLLSTSPTNEILTQIVTLDREYGGVRLSVIIKDLLGYEVFYSDEAYIEGIPSRTYSAEIEDRVWVVKCLSSRDTDNATPQSFGSFFSTISNNIRNIFN